MDKEKEIKHEDPIKYLIRKGVDVNEELDAENI